MDNIIEIAKRAKESSRVLANLLSRVKDNALKGMARALIEASESILSANEKDIKEGEKNRLSNAMIDRLKLNPSRIKGMSDSLMSISELKDPVGEVLGMWKRPNGLKVGRVRVPIGSILMIYESRPNVTSDVIGLCLKSGNSVILRGGSEALNSNIAIHKVLSEAAKAEGIPSDGINMVETPDKKAVSTLLGLNQYVDLCIPRGGEELIRKVMLESKIPVIKHYKGVCHTYVDEDADLNMAEKIAFNAKVQRPGVCNAMETLLVHKDVAIRFLPSMVKKFKDAGVEIRGCPRTRNIVKDIKEATEEDWRTEYLDLILSIRVVEDIDEAIRHITVYGSMHSDAIVTDNYERAMKFLNEVDSACVYVNASTRFTDGFEFGMGAEIGISTDKFHARGPMGLEELTSYKYIIFGNGQIRE
ncbi:MAG: glutamate-5-semialdehyde dehydrogenase [Candidatus Omnitrophica bacterium]|nr:glutamate-5-semialdehyde dehydrogenase [Candidatus Omnitrophota bacterium]